MLGPKTKRFCLTNFPRCDSHQKFRFHVHSRVAKIGGCGSESNQGFFCVSFVRASGRGEAVCACEAMLFPWLGCKSRKNPLVRACPCPCLGLVVCVLLKDM